MSRKKKKEKKISAKKEKYAKFKKEKSASVDISMPELTEEQMKQKRADEESINKFLRFNRNKPIGEIVERREKSKR